MRGCVARLSPEQFESLVAEALAALPPEVHPHLENVAVTIIDRPSRTDLRGVGGAHQAGLFGLYEGVPLTRRGFGYGLRVPDRITLFRLPLMTACSTLECLRQQIQRTVLHEVGHHLGISESRIRELGY